MKKCIVLLALTLISIGGVVLADAQTCLQQGRPLAFEGTISGMRAAWQVFDECYIDPGCTDCADNEELILLHSLTRLFMLGVDNEGSQADSVLELAELFGVTVLNDDLNHLKGETATNQYGYYYIPETAPEANEVDAIKQFMVAELEEILSQLQQISETFRVWFLASETGLNHDIEVDYADVLQLKAYISIFKGLLVGQSAYNMEVGEENDLMEIMYGGLFSIEDLLAQYPQLLTIYDGQNGNPDGTALLADFRQGLIDGINYHLAAYENMKNETDDQWDDLLSIDINTERHLVVINDDLATFRDSLINDTSTAMHVDSYEYYTLQGEGTQWELELSFGPAAFPQQGHLRLMSGSGHPYWFLIDHFEIDNRLVMCDLVEDDRHLGYFECFIDEYGNVSNGYLTYWGVSTGQIYGMTGSMGDSEEYTATANFNPLFGDSPSYPEPVSIRNGMPEFSCFNRPLPGTMGRGLGYDATAGGIFPDATQYDWTLFTSAQPAGVVDIKPVDPLQKYNDEILYWYCEQLVFDDLTLENNGDRYEEFADTDQVYMAYESSQLSINLYGSWIMQGPPCEGWNRGVFQIFLSPHHFEFENIEGSLCLNINVDSGIATGTASIYTRVGNYFTWQPVGNIEAIIDQNRLNFKAILPKTNCNINAKYLTFITRYKEDQYKVSHFDYDHTHLRTGNLATVSGRVDYPDWQGGPIYVQAYVHKKDPEGSAIATVMLDGPGEYTLESIPLGWQGYIRAFAPLFGDRELQYEAFDIERRAHVYAYVQNMQGFDLMLEYPEVLDIDWGYEGFISTDLTDSSKWYCFDAVAGETVELYLNANPGAYIELYDRDGKTKLVGPQYGYMNYVNRTVSESGRYYVGILCDYEADPGVEYSLVMINDKMCPGADIASSEWFGVKDCAVNMYDLAALAAKWCQPCGPQTRCHLADIDRRGSVDQVDLSIMGWYWMTGLEN